MVETFHVEVLVYLADFRDRESQVSVQVDGRPVQVGGLDGVKVLPTFLNSA